MFDRLLHCVRCNLVKPFHFAYETVAALFQALQFVKRFARFTTEGIKH
jgi:hypothetical protein